MISPSTCSDCAHRVVCGFTVEYENALRAITSGEYYGTQGDEVLIERFADSPFIFSVQCPYKLVIQVERDIHTTLS